MPDGLPSGAVESATAVTHPLPGRPAFLLQSGGVSPTQVGFGLVVVAIAAAYTAFALIRSRDAGLPKEQRVVRDQVRAALDEGYVTKRFDAGAIRAGTLSRADVVAAVETLFEAETVSDPETIREAGGEIRRAFGVAWREKTHWIPARALALGEWALAVLVFGSVAVATSVIVEALGVSAGRPSLGEVLSEVADAAATGFSWLLSAAGLFPGADLLVSFGLAYGLLAIEWLYAHPWVIAAVLFVVADLLLVLELRVGLAPSADRRDTEAVGARVAAAALLGGGLFVWAVGTGVHVLLRPVFAVVDHEWVAAAIGFAAAVVALAWLSVATARWLADRVRRAAHGVDASQPAVFALVTLRVCASILRPVGIAAAAIYLLVALVSGSLATVIRAYQQAAVEVQVAVAGVVLLLVTATLWEVRDAAPQVRQALVEVWARERVRISLGLRSAPYVGLAIVVLVLSGFGVPLVVTIVLAALAGLLFRIVISSYLQARRRYADRAAGPVAPASVVVGVATVQTAAGERYLLSVGDSLLAHERLSDLVETAADAIHQRACEGAVEPTVAEWYATNLREYGLADWTETLRVEHDGATGDEYLAGKLPERIRKRVVAHLRSQPGHASSREQVLTDVCDDIPNALVRRRLGEMIVAGGLRERSDGTVVLKKDIWSPEVPNPVESTPASGSTIFGN